jgi:hypothetical protein
MASMPSAAREAQEKRMARKRKMALLKQSRAQGQSSNVVQLGSVEQGKNDTGDWTYWSSLAVNSQKMGFVDPSLLSGGSISSSQMMQTMHGFGQHVSSALWPGTTAAMKHQVHA